MFACGDGEEEMVLVANGMGWRKRQGRGLVKEIAKGLRGVMEKQIWKEI